MSRAGYGPPEMQPAEALREVVAYLVFRAVDIGNNRRAAALETADEILRQCWSHGLDAAPFHRPRPGTNHS